MHGYFFLSNFVCHKKKTAFVIMLIRLYTMKVKICLSILFLFLLSACKSEEGKQLEALMDELGITFTCASDSNVVVVIPASGCASCIQGALNDVRESCDTAFVFLGSSKKELSLMYKGKKVPFYPNVYLAKNVVSFTPDIMLTYPVAYVLSDGQYVSMSPYTPLKKMILLEEKKTKACIDKLRIDLGDVSKDKVYADSVKITNCGKADLHIMDVESSCECMQVQCEKQKLLPSENTILHITFRPEGTGYFERYVFVYCNVQDSLIEILISGRVN